MIKQPFIADQFKFRMISETLLSGLLSNGELSREQETSEKMRRLKRGSPGHRKPWSFRISSIQGRLPLDCKLSVVMAIYKSIQTNS